MLTLNKTEVAMFTFVFTVVLLGFYAAHVDHEFFKTVYTIEDGLVENLGFLALLVGSFVCWFRIYKLKNTKSRWFLICTAILGTLFFFGAGEEISWGQRVFNTSSSEFFTANNSQGETNLHNLQITLESGKKIKLNKVIFGTGLGIFIALYMLVMPTLFRRKQKVKDFINSWAIPVPRPIHIIAYVILFVIVTATPSHKKGELVEFGGVFIFLLITLFPENQRNFQ